MRVKTVLIATLLATHCFGQTAAPNPGGQMFEALQPRELGPTTMGGRIMDIAVYAKEPRIFYVGFAAGGVFKTTSGGTKMASVFDTMQGISVGSVAVDQTNPDVVWVGTGEGSSRNSTLWGHGLYKSIDGGKTWALMGLPESDHIAKIAIHPKDSKVVLVAALGPLWGEGGERGLYRTDDGGASWNLVIDTGKDAGPITVLFDPKNPNNAIAATWQRRRWAYDFVSRGPKGAIWRSKDAGKTWTRVKKGLPEQEIGKIGLSYFAKDPKVVIATIETDKAKGGVYKSKDGGDSWTQLNTLNPRPFYFSHPHQDPNDANRIYVLGVGIHLSVDAGKTFRDMATPLHSDHHAMWINPVDSNHIIAGNDGGLGQSRDMGKTWEVINNMAVGQFYAATFDMRKPYWVYGGLQDNGSWAGPTQSRRGGVAYFDWQFVTGGDGFHMQVDPSDWRYVYSESQGGAIQRINQQTGESRSIQPNAVRLGEPRGTRFRFNWSSPMHISPHNPQTIYFGGNRLFKSVNRGDTWKYASPDLTTNDPNKQKPPRGDQQTGAENHCTIITIGESPLVQGTVWVGTDDGLVHLTQDDGVTWKNVTENFKGVPPSTWVSRVRPSRFVAGRCYVTFDGHRNGDPAPYVFVTEDFGATWAPISEGLPNATAYVVTEGMLNEDLLFVGTEFGMFGSMDRGKSWHRVSPSKFPGVRTDDISIHPRELDLVVGTHGRSIWLMDVSALEQFTAKEREKDIAVANPQTMYLLGRTPGGWFTSGQDFNSANTQPGTTVYYWLKNDVAGEVKIQVLDVVGREIASLTGTGKAGLSSVPFRAQRGRLPMKTTDYVVVVKAGSLEGKALLRVEDLSSSMAIAAGPGD